MGVKTTNYILFGADIGYKNYDSNKYEEYEVYDNCTKNGEITYLLDGMSGDYFYVGIVIQCADIYSDSLNFKLSDFTEELKKEYKEKLNKHVKDNFGLSINSEIIVFTHFT